MPTVHVGVKSDADASRVLEWADRHHRAAYMVPGLESPTPERVVVEGLDAASYGELREYLTAYSVNATYETE